MWITSAEGFRSSELTVNMKVSILFSIAASAAAFSFLGNIQLPSLEKLQRSMLPQKFGNKKLCIITGTSSGLGKKTAKHLLKTGDWHVIGAVRDLDKMNEVAAEEFEGVDLNNFTPLECDLASFTSVRKFASNVNEVRAGKAIDRLVFNAAVYQPTLDYAKYTEDDIEQQFQINYLSHFLLCSILVNASFSSTFILSQRSLIRCQR